MSPRPKNPWRHLRPQLFLDSFGEAELDVALFNHIWYGFDVGVNKLAGLKIDALIEVETGVPLNESLQQVLLSNDDSRAACRLSSRLFEAGRRRKTHEINIIEVEENQIYFFVIYNANKKLNNLCSPSTPSKVIPCLIGCLIRGIVPTWVQ